MQQIRDEHHGSKRCAEVCCSTRWPGRRCQPAIAAFLSWFQTSSQSMLDPRMPPRCRNTLPQGPLSRRRRILRVHPSLPRARPARDRERIGPACRRTPTEQTRELWAACRRNTHAIMGLSAEDKYRFALRIIGSGCTTFYAFIYGATPEYMGPALNSIVLVASIYYAIEERASLRFSLAAAALPVTRRRPLLLRRQGRLRLVAGALRRAGQHHVGVRDHDHLDLRGARHPDDARKL